MFTPLIPITTGTTLELRLVVVITYWEIKAKKTGLRGDNTATMLQHNCSSAAIAPVSAFSSVITGYKSHSRLLFSWPEAL